jgi:hypothetical protein
MFKKTTNPISTLSALFSKARENEKNNIGPIDPTIRPYFTALKVLESQSLGSIRPIGSVVCNFYFVTIFLQQSGKNTGKSRGKDRS